ncbi:MAG TPA: hypothetical protein VHG09_10420 [Longimicrobiales bacterium]|nr:hypothetical protein [Longimicrobiales bacterium]
MKPCPLRSSGLLALLALAILAGGQSDGRVYPAGERVDAVSATWLHDVGAPLSARAAISGTFLIEPGDGRITRTSHVGAVRAPTYDAGRSKVLIHDGCHSQSCHMAARLARGGIHASALGTPPPHV